jgi:hypothetical protein
VIATATAVGAVATGAFAAIVPTPQDGTTTTAGAEEGPLDTVLAAAGGALEVRTANPSATLMPVEFADDVESLTEEHLAHLDKAAELYQQHAREQAERDRIEALIARGGVDGWIAEALQILDLPQSFAPSVKKIIMKESGGNPRAINNWDSNARRGTPSQGLMQTIPSTYRAYVHAELRDRPITDPVANITAGVRYMIAKYGIDTLEAGGRRSSAGHYVGY